VTIHIVIHSTCGKVNPGSNRAGWHTLLPGASVGDGVPGAAEYKKMAAPGTAVVEKSAMQAPLASKYPVSPVPARRRVQ
jgi:hypothetical protein